MTTTPRRRCAAFTLIELLVVIMILAVLVAILLPSLSRARRNAMERSLHNEEMAFRGQVQSTTPAASRGFARGGSGHQQDAAPAPARPLADVTSFDAQVVLTPQLSVGTAEAESIYEVKFAANLKAARSGEDSESQLVLPLPPQIISLADLSVSIDGTRDDNVLMSADRLVWQGPLAGEADVTIAYSAVGKGLYALETPPGKISERYQLKLTANGSDVRMLDLSMQPTSVARTDSATMYTWDYKRLMFGRPIMLDVLGIAPIDRLGELSWLGPLSVITFGLVVGIIAKAFAIARFDRSMLILILGTFTGAYPLMYFAQEFISLPRAMAGAAGLVLVVIAVRAVTMMRFRVALAGIVLPAAAIMGLTLLAAVRPQLQGILLTGLSLGVFVLAMMLVPRINLHRPAPLPA